MRRSWLSVLVLGACAHTGAVEDGPDVFKIDGARFAVGALEAPWRRIDSDRGIAYRRQDDPAIIITVNATCTEVEDAPLDVLTNHLLFGLTERSFESREIIPFDGREAERTRLKAKLDGVPFLLSTVVLKKNGCVVDLFYAAPPLAFEAHLPDFDRVIEGFRMISRRS